MKTNKIVIIDLECTCWNDKDRDFQTKNAEIIEIGLTEYSRTENKILAKKSFLVKPEFSEITDFCTGLTSITPEMVKDSPNLRETLDLIVSQYRLREIMWGSWGYFDNKQLKRECKRKNIQNPFQDRNYMNLKAYVSMNQGWARAKGVENALKTLQMEFEGRAHRAIDDTYNIARILQKISKK